MKLVAGPPRTIHAVEHGFRWFPAMNRLADGTLLLYIQYTYDAHFGPVMRLRSTDGGRTWVEETENVPRAAWSHQFADGELFEIDCYGFRDPRRPHTFWYHGAWSFPGHPRRPVRQEFVRLTTASTRSISFCELQRQPCEPTHPWWGLLNGFELGERRARAIERRLGYPPVPRGFDTGRPIKVGGPYFTAGIEHAGRLVALGYWMNRRARARWLTGDDWSVFCVESQDRGRTWQEIGVAARGTRATPGGFTEASLVCLPDGRLYAVLRNGHVLHHVWSADGGRCWTPPVPLRLIDSRHRPGLVWPVCHVLPGGILVLAYGRPHKHLIFDPSGTGTQWQGHLDLHQRELAVQAAHGVPPKLRLRGIERGCRQWDSSDYLILTPVGPREMLVGYDVQNYVERRGATPISGVRLLRVRLEG
jgi:hypothetical protein